MGKRARSNGPTDKAPQGAPQARPGWVRGVLGSDHRDVHIEEVRNFARHQAELRSIRAAAEDAGVSRSAMHLFITAGTMPHLRVRRLLATWYLRGADDFELAEYARPFRKAVAMLISDLPEDRHGRALTTVLDGLEREFRAAETPPPRWLGWLRRLVPPPPEAEPAE